MELELRTLHRNAESYGGQEVTVKGWIRQNRNSNEFGFLALNDGTFFTPVQIVYEKKQLENYDEIAALNLSAAVMVKGKVVLTPDNKKQSFEINADEITVEATSDPDYPLQNKRHSMEFLREIAHLRPRSNLFSAVFRVRSLIAFAIHKFFQEQGFV